MAWSMITYSTKYIYYERQDIGMSIATAFANITAIIVEVTGLMPVIVELVVAIVPILLILAVVRWLVKWFKGLGNIMDFGKMGK